MFCTLIPPQEWFDRKSTGDVTPGWTGYLSRKSSSAALISLFIIRIWRHNNQEQVSSSCDAALAWNYRAGRFSGQRCGPYLEGELSHVGELVTLKQSSGGVVEHGGRDALSQVGHPLLQVLVWLSLHHRFLEDAAERLRV